MICTLTFCTATAPTQRYTLSLHDALPILPEGAALAKTLRAATLRSCDRTGRDRKSTRLNSSHLGISYAVFCLKKKNVHLLKDEHRLTVHSCILDQRVFTTVLSGLARQQPN